MRSLIIARATQSLFSKPQEASTSTSAHKTFTWFPMLLAAENAQAWSGLAPLFALFRKHGRGRRQPHAKHLEFISHCLIHPGLPLQCFNYIRSIFVTIRECYIWDGNISTTTTESLGRRPHQRAETQLWKRSAASVSRSLYNESMSYLQIDRTSLDPRLVCHLFS